jgi:hypothetical protein
LIIGGQKLKSNPILSAATTLESDLRPVFDVTGSAGPPGECDLINRLSRSPVKVRDQHRLVPSWMQPEHSGCLRSGLLAIFWCPVHGLELTTVRPFHVAEGYAGLQPFAL